MRRVNDVATPRARHHAVTMLAQVLSSLTNFLPGIYAAQVLGATAFGVFALIQFAYIVMLGVLRSYCTDVAVMSEVSTEPTRRHLGSVDAITMVSLAVSFTATPVVAVAVEAPIVSLVLFTLGLTVAVVQDSIRIVAITIGRARDALVNDALWLLTTVAALAIAAATLPPTPLAIAAAWMLAALPGVIFGAWRLEWWPQFHRGRWFLFDQPRLATVFLAEWSMRTGVSYVATYVLGVLGGLVTVGQIRASQLLLGPLNIAFGGLQFALMQTVLERRENALPAMRRLLHQLSAGLAGTSLLVGALIAATPQEWLAVVIGDQAGGVAAYVLPIAVAAAASGAASGSAFGLRVLHAKREVTRARAATSLAIVVGGVAGYLIDDSALGGLWGLASGGVLSIPLWVRGFNAVYRAELPTRTTLG